MNPINILSERLPKDFSNSAKVWIYQCTRDFAPQEMTEIQEQIDQFVLQWQSHGKAVHGFGGIFFDNTLIFIGQEDAEGVSGCSTDGMVRIVQSIGRQYGVELFDRMSLMFYTDEKYQRLPIHQVQYAIDRGYLDRDSLYFDVSVSNFELLQKKYIVPLAESWMADQMTF